MSKNLNINSIKIIVNASRKAKRIRASIIIQKYLRRFLNNKLEKFRLKAKVHQIMESPDTIRISPGKFPMPLYLVQRSLFEKILGKKKWKHYRKRINHNWFIPTLGILWIISTIGSSLFLLNIFNNNLLNLLLLSLSLPFYLHYILAFQDQLLILLLSSLTSKFYLLIVLLSCIGLTHMFKDNRVYNIWIHLFFGLSIIPLSDAIPRYLYRLRHVFRFISPVFIIYLSGIIFGITWGTIDADCWEFYLNKTDIVTINNEYNNGTNIITRYHKVNTFSSISYTLGLIQTLLLLLIKFFVWGILNQHRALVLKSPVLITTVNQWKPPKKYKGKNKFYVEKRLSITDDKCKKKNIVQVHLKPSFICCHIY
jgi:hypothetical protein